MAHHSYTGNSPQFAQSSLPLLPAHLQSDTQLTAHLASRFHAHLPTSQLSSQAIIALNTYSGSAKGIDGTKDGSAMAAAEDLAARAFKRLGHRSESQAIVFLGESGSGKTTIRSHLLTALLSYSATPLSQKLSYAAFVFDSLTTTKSLTTPTASKSGLLFELQYDTTTSMHPTLIGGKVLDHRLERSRITAVPTGERNFHILYYLLAGTSAAEKAHLGLDGTLQSNEPGSRLSNGAGKRWRYLGHPTQLRVGVNDTEGFQHFKTALRKLEFPRSEIAEICQILASILHIGQLEFHSSQSTTPNADDSGGYSHEGGEEVTMVKNKETLKTVAAFLGVSAQDLERSFGHKTKTLHKERVTVMLDPKGARANADEFARTLYSLLVAYVIEQTNEKICALEESVANTVSIVDFPGFSQVSSTGSTLDQLLNNVATESHYNFCLQSFFERNSDMLESEDISVPATSYFDNTDAVKGLMKHGNGLLSILDDQMRRGKTDAEFLESVKKRFNGKNPAITGGDIMATMPGSNFATHNASASFTVKHFSGEVDYPVDGLLEENAEVISGDLLNLINSTRIPFIGELFGQAALNTVVHPKEKSSVMQASVSSKPTRMPSMARRKIDKLSKLGNRKVSGGESDGGSDLDARSISKNGRTKDVSAGKQQGAAAQFLSSLDVITKSLSRPSVNPYFVFCLKPNDRRIANQFDSKCVRMQMQTFGIAEISQRLRNADYSVFVPFAEFLGLCESDAMLVGSEKEQVEMILDDKRWAANEAKAGTTGVFLSEKCWLEIANVPAFGTTSTRHAGADIEEDQSGFLTPGDGARSGYSDSHVRLVGNSQSGGPYTDDKAGGYFGSRDIDVKSEAGISAVHSGDMFKNLETREQMAEKGAETKKMEEIDVAHVSGSRKRWLFVVYMLTFFIPDFLIKWIGRMPRKDIRIAWREKLTINILIWISCAAVMFLMIGFPMLICPTQHVFSTAELTSKDGKDGHDAYVSIRGVVYDLGDFIPVHYPSIVPDSALEKYAGKDATNIFPVQVSALCDGKDGSIDEAVQLSYQNYNYTGTNSATSSDDTNAKYHDFRYQTNDTRKDWWWEQQVYLKANYYKGRIGFSPEYLRTLADSGNSIAYINERIYDFTAYIPGGRAPKYPVGTEPSNPPPDSDFMDQQVVNLFQQRSGMDVTKYWDNLNIDAALKNRMKVCLDNLFYVGQLDTRNSTQCKFATYLLLAISLLLVTVIGFKFLAALQFSRKNVPENLDKFVICTIPAYTEDEDSLRRAIDSAARMKYDDKRKLLVVICDGMIIGQGNDRPTPRIVLDILGVSESVDPEPLSFESLGEGMKQHNMGKVYSGLYEVQGHIVPFLVIVKIGKPSEVSRPGNRGKRDSQMVLMRFLNRVHYNLAMSPLELEMHHQIRNIIGVNPTFYEFLLQIDADTVVAADSATRFVANFLHDTRLIGVCGETELTNAKSSMVTMIQVYEYFISHNLTKAFESLFGSVTCLPGCFTMYRIRAAETGKPLFVSKEVVDAYAEIRVDTLHMKNLLHLGEDRYLTTLLLKFHPKYKTKYNSRAHAWTIAPDSWKVFMSQRRRWINSTVHNLMELIPMQQLCGFCCFSMRFIVFLDLVSTIIQPVIVAYLVYLIVLVARGGTSVVPITSLLLLGAIYGLQAVIFILRRKWEMIGWMIIYILATPVFACALPLYSFWHMDDFSWGNTRIVTGEKGQKIVVSDEGKFDPASIPHKKWEEYQAELWDAQTSRDDRSEISGVSYGTKHYAASEHGGFYSPNRPMSTMDMPPMPRQVSRLSLAPSGFGGYQESNMDLSELAGNLPSDDAILAEIRDILRTADLMNVTKKSIKQELERRFGVDMNAKRAYIGSATEAVLSGQL
ncbi:chitin synthase ChsE [Pseudovirgaria hyperparasitica]|uniref:chitin synthase n=1 Tax=Pseudovirgaria hyperparasitica TaxID=470096 RepID=A0A6A6WH78_9PEZI|nr:chitin synthase ChsE [Pseudovirgaria hyperparasitica]KAF2762158.1 chitin synthase ChsE [Pseudovirgaria hyperparasitica]